MRRRRESAVFTLSFLDAMTCGLGAVVLLYMIISANVNLRAERLTADLTAETDRLEREVLAGVDGLVELSNAVERVRSDQEVSRGLSRRLIETLEQIRAELATADRSTIARREHIARLQADLRSLEEDARRLSARVESDETPGDRLVSVVGDGDRQYLTGLKVGGDRVLLLVDASASMLADTVVNVVVRRNLPAADRRRAGKWRQAADTAEWLVAQLPRDASFQVYLFAEEVRPAVEGSVGRWLDGGDPELLGRAVAGVRAAAPLGGTNLYRAFTAALELQPRPDNVLLITDGLPTVGRKEPKRGTVSGKERARLFTEATAVLPAGMPINVVLLPMEGDPLAASAFWRLALASRGSFLSPAGDWP